MVNSIPRPLYPQGTDSLPLIHEAGWAQWWVRKGGENPAPHRDSIPESQPVASRHTDCPTPAHKIIYTKILINFSFCVRNVVVPAFRPNFAAVARCTQQVEQAWFRSVYTPWQQKFLRIFSAHNFFQIFQHIWWHYQGIRFKELSLYYFLCAVYNNTGFDYLKFAWRQPSAAVWVRPSLFWNVTQLHW